MLDNFGSSRNYREFVMEYLKEKALEKSIEKYMFDGSNPPGGSKPPGG